MKKVILVSIILSLLAAVPVLAIVTVPETVRIGLYYGSSAIPVITLKGEAGTQVGTIHNEEFMVLYDNSSAEGIMIRKDSYFVNSGNLVLEYKPTDKSIPAGEKVGPYHIQIGGAYNDKVAVEQEIINLKARNINAYPVYTGSWFVWSGLYIDSNSTQQAINTKLIPVLGENTYTVIQPSQQRIQVVAGDEVKLIYEGENQFIRVKPKSVSTPALININGKNFRGEVEVRRYSTSDMTIINILPLEEYLYGVVPREIGASSPIEAIKAQAVAARNYSLQSIGKNAKWGFDMTNTVSDQAYGGYEWERATSNRGVDETKGKKLMYNSKLASIFYFSTSGGRTEDVKNVWGSNDYPYLVSVEDKYESPDVPKAQWEVTLTASQIRDKLKVKGYDLGEIVSVQPTEYSEAGRVIKLVIKGTKGDKLFEREACRTIFGNDVLSQWYAVSTNSDITVLYGDGSKGKLSVGTASIKTADGTYSMQQSGNKIFVKALDSIKEYSITSSGYKFSGRGWGHAVGMSQQGAIGMAKAGFAYDQILQWYFKGTNIE